MTEEQARAAHEIEIERRWRASNVKDRHEQNKLRVELAISLGCEWYYSVAGVVTSDDQSFRDLVNDLMEVPYQDPGR